MFSQKLSFLFFIFLWANNFSPSIGQSVTPNAADCKTESGPKSNAFCVFPFKYKGETYDGCIPDTNEPDKLWCSTKTDAEGNHITGQNEFGFCNAFCPKHSVCKTVGGPKPNVPCVFPFNYLGQVFNACPVDHEDPSKTWCSTKVNEKGEHVTGAGEYGHCGPECPTVEGNEPNATILESCPGNEVCHPFIQCSALVTPEEARTKLCSQEGGSTGVCCKDVTTLDGTNSILQRVELSIRTSFEGLSNAVVRRAVDVGESFLKNVTKTRSRSNTISKTNTKSKEFQHARFQQPSPGVVQRGKTCLIAMETARNLANELGVDALGGGIQFDFSTANIDNSILDKNCPITPKCDPEQKYRNINGTCNNLRSPKMGVVFGPLQRLIPNAYADGFYLPRISKTGDPLPSPRFITNQAIATRELEHKQFTSMLVGFGQFVDHDLDHVPISLNDKEEVVQCCTSDGKIRANPEDPTLCMPFTFPEDDKLAKGKCINFVRSVCSPALDCSPGPIEQVSQVTNWLDNSQVYGSTEDLAADLRLFQDGLLRFEPCQNGGECLPFAKKNDCLGPTKRCSLTGDIRVNVTPTLSACHQLFLRHHNRLARQLKKLNPHWDDERLYQEAKRILNAEFQHIVYNELLPVLLGNKYMSEHKLLPLTSGHTTLYKDDFDPTVTNEFAVAAYRIGHTFITEKIKLYKNQRLTGFFQLKDAFANGDIIRSGNNFEEVLAGMTIQPVEPFDTNFADDVISHLFDDQLIGMDLIALNMQRGRDHGIPGYVHYRDICNTGPSSSFEDLANNMSPDSITRLKKAYEHVEDIDLFMGMTHEKPCEVGGFIGCTFACIIGDTFARVRQGDRFFYDMPDQPHSFTEDQLKQIRRTSLARIICDNTNIGSVSPMVFRQPDPVTNPITACKSKLFLTGIPAMDMSVFQE